MREKGQDHTSKGDKEYLVLRGGIRVGKNIKKLVYRLPGRVLPVEDSTETGCFIVHFDRNK